ncbi:MAG: MFS transporter [Pseudomonadota bacterium]
MVTATDHTSTEAEINRIIDHGGFNRRQVALVAMCMLFNLLDGFDITAMAVVANPVGEELGLGADRLGWLFSAALAGMMAGAMLLAPLSDRYGRRLVVIVALGVVACAVLLIAVTSNLAGLVFLRFISGCGAGAILASQAALAAEYSPPKFRAAIVAIVTSGYPLGAMSTSLVAQWLLPEYGWRSMFIFGGVLTLLMSVIAITSLPESIRFLLVQQPANALARVNATLQRFRKPALDRLPAPPATVHDGPENFLRVLLGASYRRQTLFLWSAFFMCVSTLYFLQSWIPKLVEDSGFSAADGRSAFFLFNFGGVCGIYLMSALSTRWSLNSLIAQFAILAGISMMLFANVEGDRLVIAALILVVGILQQGAFTGLYPAAAAVYPTRVRSAGIGWAIGLGRFGAVVGPALAGYLIAAGFGLSFNFFVFAIPMFIGALLAYRLILQSPT